MSNKKIVMIGNTSWGMLKFRSDLMRDLLSKHHEVLVIAPKDEWSQEIVELGCRFQDLKVDRKGTNPVTDFLYMARLARLFFKENPHTILCYTIKPVLYGSVAAWIARVPNRVAITTGLGYIFSKDNFVSKITKKLYKFCLKFATQVWFLNSDDLQTFLNAKLVHPSKTFVLPGEGVDVDFYSPRKKISSHICFTLIGRMLWDKGVGIFVECAEELKKDYPHLQFQIVGPVDEGNPEGIPADKLEAWNIKGFVKYLGPTNDVRGILQNTTCLVHPTYYKEGIPRVLMEANAMGIPCITTDIPGCRDVIKNNENGLLVKPNDKEDLKKAILTFIALGNDSKEKMAAVGRERMIQNYSSTKINSIYSERLSL
jgi:glycosyltransferase involved in cell wall biosynthesis